MEAWAGSSILRQDLQPSERRRKPDIISQTSTVAQAPAAASGYWAVALGVGFTDT